MTQGTKFSKIPEDNNEIHIVFKKHPIWLIFNNNVNITININVTSNNGTVTNAVLYKNIEL